LQLEEEECKIRESGNGGIKEVPTEKEMRECARNKR